MPEMEVINFNKDPRNSSKSLVSLTWNIFDKNLMENLQIVNYSTTGSIALRPHPPNIAPP